MFRKSRGIEFDCRYERDARTSGGSVTCSYYTKKSTDFHYGQIFDNTTWHDYATENGGVTVNFVKQGYVNDGYTVESYKGTFDKSSVVWMAEQMESNHVVHIAWQPRDSIGKGGHISLMAGIQQHIKTGAYRFNLMDPANYGDFDLDSLYKIFSVWR